MKRRFALFVILTLVCTGLFAKEYEHYAWCREKHEDRYISITLEVYSPHDEGISEKAAEKLDEIEETFLKTVASLIPSPRAIHISVIYIGSISTPLYKVHSIHDLRKSSDEWYIHEVYNKKNEKILSEEVEDRYGVILCYIVDKLVGEVYPDKHGSTKYKYKIGDKGPGGGTIFYANGNIAYEVSEKFGELNKNAISPFRYGVPYCYWDIPTSQQLEDIYNNLVKQGFFEKYKNEVVWSSSKNAAGQPIVMSFSDGELYYLEDEFIESGIASLFLVQRFAFTNE